MPLPETPRKAQKIDAFSTPGSMRRFAEMESGSSAVAGNWRTPASADDVFTTPKTPSQPLYPRLQLPSPTKTPTPNWFKDPPLPLAAQNENVPQADSTSESSLTSQVLTLLTNHHISLPPTTKQDLQQLLNRHDLRTQGIMKGREISRIALKDKDLKIAELQGRIGSLEAEKEMNRNVISHLKSDILASSSKRRGRKT